jgi:hypothetical protein
VRVGSEGSEGSSSETSIMIAALDDGRALGGGGCNGGEGCKGRFFGRGVIFGPVVVLLLLDGVDGGGSLFCGTMCSRLHRCSCSSILRNSAMSVDRLCVAARRCSKVQA